MIDESRLELYWSEIPVGRENAVDYDILCALWDKSSRKVREILHELSRYDNGDDLILIRSSSGTGFYRTSDPADIKAYRAECLNRGRNTLAPLKKIDRVLAPDDCQINFENNLKAVRVSCGLNAKEVCEALQLICSDPAFDPPMLSRMENGKCLPTPRQLSCLAKIYGCAPSELVNADLYQIAN